MKPRFVRSFVSWQKDEIICLYLAGFTSVEIGRRIGRLPNVILAVLHERGVAVAVKNARRYTLDESYFEKIDTPEKAWLLGFMAADAWVLQKGFAIRLCAQDREILERIRAELKTDVPLRDRPAKDIPWKTRNGKCVIIHSGPQVELGVSSQKMARDLMALGIVPNKAGRIVPCSVPTNLLRHWWRGCVDGDGSVAETTGVDRRGNRRPRTEWSIHFGGNLRMVQAFSEFVKKHVDWTNATVRPDGKNYRVDFRGRVIVRSVACLLYEDATIALARKLAVARMILADEG